ncbi:MAG: peptidoglycan DD-metalloendopeptidase family protein [Christensenellales bacterium]|jgi:murein DD-endopeptidase MepM/ murein hydrolase activator NlpD
MKGQFFRKIRSIWEKAGFYVVLGLCVTTVAITAHMTGKEKDEPIPTIPPVAATRAPQATPRPTLPSDDIADILQASVNQGEKLVTIPELPIKGDIVGRFSLTEPSYNKTLGHYAIHPGIDIAAHESMPVHSCANGVVTDVYEDPMLGNVIEIDHGSFTAIYGSLSTLSMVRVGDPVSYDQTISFAGTCPGEMHLGSHVHFETLINGEHVDPLTLLE